jgi:release factor glutamine methyltransferase
MQLQPPILIPRPETEEWTGRLLSLLLKIQAPRDAPPLKLLDFCTGTGCIPLLLCSGLVPGRLMATGVDILPEAVDLARRNALANGITLASPSPAQMTSSPEGEEEKSGLSNTFKSLQIDLFSNDALETFVANPCTNPDVLTSNPPYIPLSDMQSLDRSVLEFESPLALTGDVLSSALSDSVSHDSRTSLRSSVD